MPTGKFFNLPDKSADSSPAHGGITFISRGSFARFHDPRSRFHGTISRSRCAFHRSTSLPFSVSQRSSERLTREFIREI